MQPTVKLGDQRTNRLNHAKVFMAWREAGYAVNVDENTRRTDLRIDADGNVDFKESPIQKTKQLY